MATLNDTKSFYLSSRGYTGSLSDMEAAWRIAEGYGKGTLYDVYVAAGYTGQLNNMAYNYFSQPISGSNLILDDHPTSLIATSFKLLLSSYVGSCCRVRRASDSTEQDIGFVNGLVDTSAIATFCGASNGFIAKFYDQNGFTDLFNTTLLDQPKIYNGSSVLTNSAGHPAMTMDNNRQHLRSAFNPATSINATFVLETVADDQAIPLWSGVSTKYAGGFSSGDAASPHSDSGTPTTYVNGSVVSPETRGQIYTDLRQDGPNTLSLEGMGISSWGGFLVFGYSTTGSVWQYGGSLSELVLWHDSEITTPNFLLAEAASRSKWS